MFKPFDYQIDTINYLLANKRLFLSSEQGTGKTACGLWASSKLIDSGEIRKVLIITTIANSSDWLRDIENTGINKKGIFLKGNKKKLLSQDYDYYIINYDGVASIVSDIYKKGFDLVIIDELTHYKESSTNRFKKTSQAIFNIPYRWGFTATPFPERPLDAFAQVKLINPTNLLKTAVNTMKSFREYTMHSVNYSVFKKNIGMGYYDPFSKIAYIPRTDWVEKVKVVYSPFFKVRKSNVLDLPKKIYYDVFIPLNDTQEELYQIFKKHSIIELDNIRVISQSKAVQLNKLRQITAGSVIVNEFADDIDDIDEFIDYFKDKYKELNIALYENDKMLLDIDNDYRNTELINIIDKTLSKRVSSSNKPNHKVIVYVPFLRVQSKIYNMLTSKGYKAIKINGSLSREEKTDIINNFQNTYDYDIIVAIPKTIAHGVTLTSANSIIWYSPIDSTEIYMQGCDRTHRIGQDYDTYIYNFYSCQEEKELLKKFEKSSIINNNL